MAAAGAGAGAGATKVAPSNHYGLTMEGIATFNQDQMRDENKAELQRRGGVEAIAQALKVSLKSGLSHHDKTDLNLRQQTFGENRNPEPPMTGWWALFFESFKDLILIVLCIAAVISFVVGLLEDPEKGWIDGVAILIAVLLVAIVTATNDYQKELQFRALNSKKDDIKVKVIRDNEQHYMSVFDIVVGDIVKLEAGDKVPCDGVFVSGDETECNESSLTGEPDDLKKNTQRDPFLLSGCKVTKGNCLMLVIAVGKESRWGRIKSALATEAKDTPLQEKLNTMAQHIGYVGGGCALATLIALIIVYFATDSDVDLTKYIIDAFIIAVTIIVVAVPEGLPLAVTISLAFSTKKMLADNNLIRVLAACETMGNATNICSDKTGTLTENRMTVVATWFNGVFTEEPPLPSSDALGSNLADLLRIGLSVNSTAVRALDDNELPIVVGSKTEGALLGFVEKIGGNWKTLREETPVLKQFPFSSEKKTMTTIVTLADGSHRMFVKGASEIVLGRCTKLHKNGQVVGLEQDDIEELNAVILKMARGALRTIAIAHRDFAEGELPEDYITNTPDDDLVFEGITGIMDPLRSDVKEAVATVQKAGIMVRMVTGDNIETAKAIARQCGILTEGGLAMEGPAFRNLTGDELDKILPTLQVLARSSPDDKHTLVQRLNGAGLAGDELELWQNNRGGPNAAGEIVGVTGDGTNDAPALKVADVGLSMGISGTEVAKDASDIVIMDDKFSSIKQAVLWGRSVYDNIRKFLQFQLTVNVVALALTFLAAVIGFHPPLNPVMMLWVNLIMDTMGALALGTEAPTLDLLDRRPYKRAAHLVSRPMIRNILVQSLYQLVVLMILLLAGGATETVTCTNTVCTITHDGTGLFGSYGIKDGRHACAVAEADGGGGYKCTTKDYTHFTFIFNVFVWCQLFNEFNARRINDDWNVFRGLARNYLFNAVIIVSILLQAFIVEFGGEFTKTTGLSWELWLWSFGLGLVSLPLGILMRFIPVAEAESSFGGYKHADDVSASAVVKVNPNSVGGGAGQGAGATATPAAGSGGT